jgi:hypothetical protein
MDTAQSAVTVVIDDVQDAIDSLTDLGLSVVAPTARRIRDAVLFSCALHGDGWHIISHSAFVQWAVAQTDQSGFSIVLDPLFDARLLGDGAAQLNVSRVATATGVRLSVSLPPDVAKSITGLPVHIIDDVAASGMTLRSVAGAINAAGGRAAAVMLCASSYRARDTVMRDIESCLWTPWAKGDCRAIHLRDACPFLPHSGKQIQKDVNVRDGCWPVETTLPVTVFRGGVWERLRHDRNLNFTLAAARKTIARQFSEALGRPARVSDLPLLGPRVRLPLSLGQSANLESTLEGVCGG